MGTPGGAHQIKKIRELKGVFEKAQETRPEMSQKHEIGHWEHHKIIDISCSVSCDIVKSSAKP